MLALNWNDIDLDNRLLYVNKTIQSNLVNRDINSHKKTTDKLKKGAKTNAGSRVLPINDLIIFYINELKQYDYEHNIKSLYVCCTRIGTREVSRNLQRSLNLIQSKFDIGKHITLHTLRHSFGSSLIRKGIDISVVSKLMGHANITITYNKYIHVIQEQQAKAMELARVC